MTVDNQPYEKTCEKCGNTILMRFSRKKEKWYATNKGKTPEDKNEFFHVCSPKSAPVVFTTAKELLDQSNARLCPLRGALAHCEREKCQWWVATEADCVVKCLIKR